MANENIIDETLQSRCRQNQSVVDLRPPAAIRMQAQHLRNKLLSRNAGDTFRNILADLSDKILVEMDAAHHAWQVKNFQVEQRAGLLVTPAMREAAFRKDARRRSPSR